jgi:resuscitation-promoting factor RpfB
MQRSSDWLKSLSAAKKALLGIVALFVVLGIIGSQQPTAKLSTANSASLTQTQQAKNTQKPKAPTVTTQTETEVQSIPFATSTVQSPALAKGTTKVTTAGVNGSETLTYQVTDTNGQQTSKQLINTSVTLQPVTQITSVGTYVAPTPPPAPSCTNGTYVNSAGNTVCSPEAASSTPAGATAHCVDGTYSFSQSRSGTCSHHGGVATWL